MDEQLKKLELELNTLDIGCAITRINPINGKSPFFCCRLFDGEPCGGKTVAYVSNWREVEAEAPTIQQSLQAALEKWNNESRRNS